MTKPHITSMGCFKQVAAVLGRSRAQLELWKAVHYEDFSPLDLESRYVWLNFRWSKTPQGSDFWNSIDNGTKP